MQRRTGWGQNLVGFLLLIARLERDKGVREGAPESGSPELCCGSSGWENFKKD